MTRVNPIAHATLYRLRASDGSELKNPPVRITLFSARYWRVRVARNAGGGTYLDPDVADSWRRYRKPALGHS